jgi:nucleotide-binding universal stress UspA family protein
MPEKILIPLDGSKVGEAALRFVEKLVVTLSAENKVEVTLLQVLSPPFRQIYRGSEASHEVPFTEEEREALKTKAIAYLDEAGEGLRRMGAIVNSKVALRDRGGSSAEKIIEAEDDTDADLVAMSTHGRRGLSKWAFGSVTDKVLRAGKLPVLVVRAGKETERV